MGETAIRHGGLAIGIDALLATLVLAVCFYTPDPAGDIKWLFLSWGAFLLAAALILVNWRKPFRRPALFLELLVVFLALQGVSSLMSDYVGNAFLEWRKFWSLFLLYVVATQVYGTEGQIRRTMLVVCVFIATSSIYAIVFQRYGLDPLPWSDKTSEIYTTMPATFGNPNFAGHTLILGVIMALFLATRRRMIWCLGFAALFLVHLCLAEYRAGFVALGVAALMIVVAVITRGRVRRPVKATVITVMATGAIMGCGVVGYMAFNHVQHGTLYPIDQSLSVRYKSYVSAAKMILAKPVFGYGMGNYRIQYPEFWTPYEQQWFAQELRQNSHVHNDLLELAVDAGLPGAGIYFAFLILGVCYGLLIAFSSADPARRRLGYAFAAFFCAFLVDGLFGFNLRVPVSAGLLFVMAGALDATCTHEREESEPIASARPLYLWRLALLAAGLAFVLLDTGIFASRVIAQKIDMALRLHDYEGALRLAGYGEQLAPGNWQFPRQRGLVLLEKREWDSAIVAFERSLQLNPYHVMADIDIGRAEIGKAMALLLEQKDREAATQCLNRAEEYVQHAQKVSPLFAPVEDLLGRIFGARAVVAMETGNVEDAKPLWKESEEHFCRALEYGAKNPQEIYPNLGQVRLALADKTGAEDAYRNALNYTPDRPELWAAYAKMAKTTQRGDSFLAFAGKEISASLKEGKSALAESIYYGIVRLPVLSESDRAYLKTQFSTMVEKRVSN